MARKEKLLAMLETDSEDPFLHYALGKEYLSCGERTEAIEKLRDVLVRFPNYHAAHFQLGQVLAEDDEFSQAIEIVKAGIIAAQQDGDSHAVSEMTGFLDTLGQ